MHLVQLSNPLSCKVDTQILKCTTPETEKLKDFWQELNSL